VDAEYCARRLVPGTLPGTLPDTLPDTEAVSRARALLVIGAV
jgi:hypothetical protein